jgi:hypothetical protein
VRRDSGLRVVRRPAHLSLAGFYGGLGLSEQMTRFSPDAPLGWVVPLGADPVAAALAAS